MVGQRGSLADRLLDRVGELRRMRGRECDERDVAIAVDPRCRGDADRRVRVEHDARRLVGLRDLRGGRGLVDARGREGGSQVVQLVGLEAQATRLPGTPPSAPR